MRFGETKVPKQKFYAAKNPINFWDIDIDNKVYSKLIERKINYKCLTWYLDTVIRSLVLILPKVSEYVKIY